MPAGSYKCVTSCTYTAISGTFNFVFSINQCFLLGELGLKLDANLSSSYARSSVDARIKLHGKSQRQTR